MLIDTKLKRGSPKENCSRIQILELAHWRYSLHVTSCKFVLAYTLASPPPSTFDWFCWKYCYYNELCQFLVCYSHVSCCWIIHNASRLVYMKNILKNINWICWLPNGSSITDKLLLLLFSIFLLLNYQLYTKLFQTFSNAAWATQKCGFLEWFSAFYFI